MIATAHMTRRFLVADNNFFFLIWVFLIIEQVGFGTINSVNINIDFLNAHLFFESSRKNLR